MANSLSYLAGEVYTVTRRPDLVNQTIQAIREATLKLHQRAFYPKDLTEFFIDFGAGSFIQQFEYKTFVPLWRALSYFKHPEAHHWDQHNIAESGIYGGYPWQRTNKEFDIITPDNIFNVNGYLKTDVAYLSGIHWNLRGSWCFKRVRCGCYLNPDVTQAGYSSWIADQHEFAVVRLAAVYIFTQIGLDAEATRCQAQADEYAAVIDTNNLLGVGY